jgi:RNA polymerase sigma factor (sigma-70 family)
MSDLLAYVRRAALRADTGLSDAELLEGFRARGDQAAFEALVRRHGPMVWGVCRRVLRRTCDAEDAFQATFLVLVRKAGCIRPAGHVGRWLHGVAYRTATRARAQAARRVDKERQAQAPVACRLCRDDWQELLPLLDQAIDRLPERYRDAVLLCELQGKSRRAAARQLGWPEGTLSGRLARARRLLAKRLAQHGPPFSATALAAALARQATAAPVPARLMHDTARAAGILAASGVVPAKLALLMHGVLKAMLLNKLKFAAALFVGSALLLGVGGVYRMQATGQQPEVPAAAAAVEPSDEAESDLNLPKGPAPVQVLARV